MSAPSEKHSKGGLDHDPIIIEPRISPEESLVLGFPHMFFVATIVTAVGLQVGQVCLRVNQRRIQSSSAGG